MHLIGQMFILKRKPHIVLAMLSIFIFGISGTQKKSDELPVLKDPYLGQKPPGLIPEVFATGIISKAGFHLHSSIACAKDSTMYLTSGRSRPEIGMYSFDIYVSHIDDGIYSKPQRLDQPVTPNKSQACLIVEPDEGYSIFYRSDSNHPDEPGLYLSCSDRSGKWTKGKNMGKLFDSGMESVTQAASLSPDGKYLFFQKRMEESIYLADARIINNLRTQHND